MPAVQLRARTTLIYRGLYREKNRKYAATILNTRKNYQKFMLRFDVCQRSNMADPTKYI
jgi:hypothetical protein